MDSTERCEIGYVEKPVKKLLSRRSFLKITGICIAAIAISGYAITDVVEKRNSYILLRQKGLYKDDEIHQKEGLTFSNQNASCHEVYKDLGTKPTEKVAEELLHTTYVDRSNFLVKGGRLYV